ncbi:MAG TPA: response regulator [Longimicrobiaceae bacterium]|nr:response regulator [Longimicrobiaceae bacterium]
MSRLVLLVEDNPTDEKLALRAFARCPDPPEMAVARDGVQALERLFGGGEGDEAAALPALVLLDLKLPRIDGLEVIRRIRAEARTRLVPIVVLTASRQEEDVLRSYALGANAYVRKPVDYGEFVEAAHAISAFWLGLNEPPPAGGGEP